MQCKKERNECRLSVINVTVRFPGTPTTVLRGTESSV